MQAMALNITDFRFSLIWALPCLEPAAGATAPFADRAGFENQFNAAQKSGAVQGLSPPWPPRKAYAHRFWSNYLQVGDPSRVDGGNAWKKAVPLRVNAPPFKVEPGKFPGAIVSEHYLYPFGIAFILTFYGNRPLSGPDWVAAIQSAASSKLMVRFGSAAAAEFPVVGLASETLRQMREKYFGANDNAPTQPFTIATVIRGEGAIEDVAPKEGTELHRWLFGVTSRQKNWRTAKLDEVSLADCALTIRRAASPGDVVFATPRGRAIWIPSSFAHPGSTASDGSPQTSMSCYHRNQLFAALQTESLCRLAKAITDRISTKRDLPTRVDDFGSIAVRTLIDLDAGDQTTTYRSISVQQQIKDLAPDIKTLRTRYGI
jgi:hypothetical protein